MSIALHLMRHGEPVLTGRMLGRTDCAATEDGIAACVAQAADLGAVRVVTSDLIRAAACARAIDGNAVVDPRWREIDFGDWDGLAAADIDQQALGAFWDDPDADPPPGGERWSALVARVGAAVGAAVGAVGAVGAVAAPTLVVTHGGAMRAALAGLCGFDHRQAWAFDLPYACVLSLRIWPGDGTAQIVGLYP